MLLVVLLLMLLLMKLMFLTPLLNNLHHRNHLLLLQRSHIASPLDKEVDGHIPANNHNHMRQHDANKHVPRREHVQGSTK